MCIACSPAILDKEKSDAFAGRMMEMINSAGLAMMISLGHRTGLLDAMKQRDSFTIAQLAMEASLSERYVREWLGAMTCGRIVEHDSQAMTYRLPPEHAALLTRAATPNNFAAVMQWVAVLGSAENEVADAFRHGKGVPYSAYRRFNDVMAEESGQTVLSALDDHILPLIPGLIQRLQRGIDVLDVGCGRGRALMQLAERFPRSRFLGYDAQEDALAAACAEARSRGLVHLRFQAVDAVNITDTAAFDLITTFDAIHDQAQPAKVLSNIHRALRPDGVYLCQEIKGESEHAGNLNQPLAPFLYTISTMHCMSVSLAGGGAGLGAMWGRTLCRRMLAEAGFNDVTMNELSHDVQNDWYVCRAID